MRPQVSMSLHLEGLVGMRESFMVHTVSHLVLIVSYMYVTMLMTEFRYSSFVYYTVNIIHYHDHVIIWLHHNMCKQKRVTSTFEMPGLTLYTTLLFRPSLCVHCALHNDYIIIWKCVQVQWRGLNDTRKRFSRFHFCQIVKVFTSKSFPHGVDGMYSWAPWGLQTKRYYYW